VDLNLKVALGKFWGHGWAAPVAAEVPQEKKIWTKKMIFPLYLP